MWPNRPTIPVIITKKGSVHSKRHPREIRRDSLIITSGQPKKKVKQNSILYLFLHGLAFCSTPAPPTPSGTTPSTTSIAIVAALLLHWLAQGATFKSIARKLRKKTKKEISVQFYFPAQETTGGGGGGLRLIRGVVQ
jgi:hypothetical protein